MKGKNKLFSHACHKNSLATVPFLIHPDGKDGLPNIVCIVVSLSSSPEYYNRGKTREFAGESGSISFRADYCESGLGTHQKRRMEFFPVRQRGESTPSWFGRWMFRYIVANLKILPRGIECKLHLFNPVWRDRKYEIVIMDT